MRFLLLVLVVLAVIGAGVVEWGNAAWEVAGPPAADGKETVVLIPPRTPIHDIAAMLEQKGVLKFGLLFEADLRLRGLAGKVKAGEYAIPSAASMAKIADILVSGRAIQHKLTAAEGLTSEMIWKLVQADPVLTGDAGPMPAEGTLLPETYLFTRGETRAHILDKMARAQEKLLAEKWPARAQGLPIATRKEAIILASLVEKETSLPQERRHIAGVFVNRLKAGIKLQTDPTIIYDITRGYPLGRGIRQSELAAASPHNTYVLTGLPPTPICNPGKDSIDAVLDPDATRDLYFVASGQGGHVFSATMAEHLRNVAAWRAITRHEPQVTPNGQVENAPVTVPDAVTPALPKAAAAHRKHARRR
ncbi:MAG TPA: endolytic transglycosylase MltG [Rhizomicrobium sp.]